MNERSDTTPSFLSVAPVRGRPPVEDTDREEFDYVIVGSGAGGGPVAANLAEAGHTVLLLEAGGREERLSCEVPAFHALATEDESLRWDLFVRHYDDDVRQRRDTKYVAEHDGIWYPRAGTLGGCATHNAMITVCPHASDWDTIARLTGDETWRDDRMRRWFQRLEHCTYVRRPLLSPRNPRLAAALEQLPLVPKTIVNRGRHGFDGWLSTSLADPRLVLRDERLLQIIIEAAGHVLAETLGRPLTIFEGLDTYFDPNDWRVQGGAPQGLWMVPMSTSGGRRAGVRERLGEVRARHPDRLVVRSAALVTRVLIDETGTARGVEFLDARHAYRADPQADAGGPPPAARQVLARREIVLSAGAFNTPQLLMLSGIGPREELERHGIPVRIDLPGVGANLQDRYEAGVVFEMDEDFALIENCGFEPPGPGVPEDRCLAEWRNGKGVYTSNGAVIGVTAKSRPGLPVSDLFLFGLPAFFRGYYPGYSRDLQRNRRFFTWAVLKAHTRNAAGRVTLRGDDPRDPPRISFRYFDEGDDRDGSDLDAVVHGIELARRIMERTGTGVRGEVLPGKAVRGAEELRRFVRDEAWGHHASCTARIGPPGDPMAVVDSRFRVRGIRGLRVVDASVFPRIPGFFIVTAVYMIAEKASAAILADAADALRTRAGFRAHGG
ncbi:GMC family oxidoreductase N-terminal domain-containing protein [Microbispora sp. NEAU-D428]|uniref:GMC family oxidoreductase n=1 Tax=Microbispora sitophila TaxID=2771537 RepID=UPI0018683AC6|nr:GMC oxidoreductase [Microbispora sitophila]MBE3010168.1 GMC family oxidoreductase N-terminal domain-containing protein [Microbispora sitophila]